MLVVALVVALTGGSAGPGVGSRAVVTAGGTQTVTVSLAGMRITPSVIEVTKGTRLVLKGQRRDLRLVQCPWTQGRGDDPEHRRDRDR